MALPYFVVASCAWTEPPGSAPAAGVAEAPRVSASAGVEGAESGARTYSGTYSCDGCIARRLSVTIFADGSYRLREVPARGEPVGEHGRWHVAAAAPDRIVLETAGGARALRRTAPDELTIVDHEGRELRGLTGGVLARSANVDPLPDLERFVGLYGRSGGLRVLVDCASGGTLRVLDETTRAIVPGATQQRTPARGGGSGAAAQAALDAAWTELAPHADETVLVVVHAHRVAPDAGAGAADGEAIVVDAFERATRNGRCGAAPSSMR